MGSVGAALCWQHRRNGESTSASHANRLGRCAGVVFLFYFASAVGSRDGSRNPRMAATCAPSLIEKIIINNDRNNNDAAKGRGSWERIRWPDAKFEVTSAKCDLRNEQLREKREESRERREERREKREARGERQARSR